MKIIDKLALEHRKKLFALAFLTGISSFVTFIVSIRLESSYVGSKLKYVGTSTAIKNAIAHKHAFWIDSSNTLVVDKSSGTSAKIPESMASSQISLLSQKINVDWVGSLNDLYSSPISTRLNLVAGMLFIATILLSTLSLSLGIRASVIRDSEEKNRQLAKTAGKNEVNIDYETPDTTFSDVAGCVEAVESLSEMSLFLKSPKKFEKMGVKMPAGAVLSGPPGTGKTLLARALAGEAKVPFFVANGSEFTELYVGAGAKNVRDLFTKIRKHDKAILFIDEIDAVARKRSGSNVSNANTEAEGTLNQLLTEIDGFNNKNSNKSVLVIAATNRPDLLDPALTRSGRLERQIEVPNPDRRGRQRILELHSKNKPLAYDVDLALVAARTPGFSGADMSTIVNEAGIIAVRENYHVITQKYLDQAVADVAMGRARKSALLTDSDRRITAWHEAGHTLCAYLQPHHDDPVAVSIVPRGAAGGITWMSGSDNIFLSKQSALSQIVTAFGGRVGEELLLDGECTQGASSDFQKATEIAYNMVTQYGMTELGFQTRSSDVAAGNKEVTDIVEEILQNAYVEATKLLSDNFNLFSSVVEKLLEHDDVSYTEIEELADQFGVKHERTMESIPELPQKSSVGSSYHTTQH